MNRLLVTALLLPTMATAEGLTVDTPWVPLAPPGAMAHVAYMTLGNPSDRPQDIIGVSAEGYGMAHVHLSEVKDDVATMSAVDVLAIGAGQTVTLDHGGLHIMLMRPLAPKAEGDVVAITFAFADGTTQQVNAMVMKADHGM